MLLLVVLVGACRNAPPAEQRAPEPSIETSTTSPSKWDPWQDAKSRGIEFRAVGNEPGWFLEIDQQKWMRVLYAYGERMVTTPVPMPSTEGSVTRYQASGSGHALDITISDGPCSDGMSDQSYPLTVAVNLDGTELRGCGRWLNR
jgi:putative lipoprotein